MLLKGARISCSLNAISYSPTVKLELSWFYIVCFLANIRLRSRMKFCVKAICRHKIAKTKKIGLAPGSNVNEKYYYWFIIDLTNRMCLNVVYSFIDNKETEPLSWQLNTPTRIWKCTRRIMQMSCLYASDSFIRELKRARFWDADGNRKSTFCVLRPYCLPYFFTTHL